MKAKSTFSIEKILQTLGALGVIASALAYVLTTFMKRHVSTELISFVMITGVIFYIVFVYLRLQRNAPFPFPRFFWQIFFNSSGAAQGKFIDKMRIAILSAPDGQSFGKKLAESDSKLAYTVKLANNNEAEPEAYSSEKIVIDLLGTKEEDGPTFHHLLKNVQGAIIVWTDGWLRYPWALKIISEWAMEHSKNPLAIAQLEESNFPDSLNWINFDKVGKSHDDYIQKNTPTGLLLRQATTRHQRLQKHSRILWLNTMALWITIFCLSFFSYKYITNQLSKVKKFQQELSIGPSTIKNLSTFGNSLRTINENTLKNHADSTNIYEHIYTALKTFELAIENQLNNNYKFPLNSVELDVFYPNDTGLHKCLCESTIDTDKIEISCFPFDKGIVSCSYENNWIVHWEYFSHTASSTIARDLNGKIIEKNSCSYMPESKEEAKGETEPQYEEILCFPICSPARSGYRYIESHATVCISLYKRQGILGSPSFQNNVILLSQLLHSIPWEWYSQQTNVDCNVNFENSEF